VEAPRPKPEIKQGKASGQSLLTALLPTVSGRQSRDTLDGMICVSGGLISVFEVRHPPPAFFIFYPPLPLSNFIRSFKTNKHTSRLDIYSCDLLFGCLVLRWSAILLQSLQ
jgi:hypothetical protein